VTPPGCGLNHRRFYVANVTEPLQPDEFLMKGKERIEVNEDSGQSDEGFATGKSKL
jgi:hypothetical protein